MRATTATCTRTTAAWQKTTSSGTQSAAPEDTSWPDREQQARSASNDRFNSFQNGGGAFKGWGQGNSSFADRFSAGGFGDRFGDGDVGDRFGGFRGGGGFRRSRIQAARNSASISSLVPRISP